MAASNFQAGMYLSARTRPAWGSEHLRSSGDAELRLPGRTIGMNFMPFLRGKPLQMAVPQEERKSAGSVLIARSSGQSSHNLAKSSFRTKFGEPIEVFDLEDYGIEDDDLDHFSPSNVPGGTKEHPSSTTHAKIPSSSTMNGTIRHPLPERSPIGAQLIAAASQLDNRTAKPQFSESNAVEIFDTEDWDRPLAGSISESTGKLSVKEWERQALSLIRRKKKRAQSMAILQSKKASAVDTGRTSSGEFGVDFAAAGKGLRAGAVSRSAQDDKGEQIRQKLASEIETLKQGPSPGSPKVRVQRASILSAAAKAGTAHHLSKELQIGTAAEVPAPSVAALLKANPRWIPLVEYLKSLGMGEEGLQRVISRRREVLQLNVFHVKDRVLYLESVGVLPRNIAKTIARNPQLLEYQVGGVMRLRVQYLLSIGIPKGALGDVITKYPTILECSVEDGLKPKVKYLKEVLGLSEADIPKLVQRCPQVLTQSIQLSLAPRVEFLHKELGIPKSSLAQIIIRHPQLLHYSMEEGMRPRIEFLKSIGMSRYDIIKVLTRLPQILSLSLEKTLRPKYEYLRSKLGGTVETVTSFPAYFSLSLELRIKPRHEFLVARRLLRPQAALPMRLLALTDKDFCRQIGATSEDDYRRFREELLRLPPDKLIDSGAGQQGHEPV